MTKAKTMNANSIPPNRLLLKSGCHSEYFK